MKDYRAPHEDQARGRTWSVVRAAFEQRERVPWPRRHGRALAAVAVAAAAVAALLSPPGRSVVHSLREAVGVEHAQTGLFSLPARGRLLVRTHEGVWVVHADGSKRLLHGYRDASWSPHGLYVVGTKPDELAAVEDDGDVHWTLARRRVRFPRWTGSRTDTRIAYACRRCPGRTPAIRVVGGDGRGDHWVTKDFLPVAPAWQPGPRFRLAVAHTDGRIRLWGTDRGALVATTRKTERPLALAWTKTQDHYGSFLHVLTRARLYLFDAHGRLTALFRIHRYAPGWRAAGMAVAPRGPAAALLLKRGDRSEVVVVGEPRGKGFRSVFSGAGRFTGLDWSPDGRWLLVAWKDANQWVFIRSTNVKTIRAVSHIRSQVDTRSFPGLAGWCCP